MDKVLRRILVVEDNDINRTLLCQMLADSFETIETVNGQEACDVLSRDYLSISAVLLDIFMPIMDGYEVLKKVHNDPKLSTIPVIVMTSDNDPKTTMRAMELGASSILPKPYKKEIIKQHLEASIFAAQRRFREASEQLRIIMAHINGGVSATYFDEAGDLHFVYASEQYYELFGYTQRQFEAEISDFIELAHPEDKKKVSDSLQRLLHDGGSDSIQYRARKRDGEEIIIRCNISIIAMDGVSDKVMLSVANDITHYVKARKSAAVAADKLQIIMESINGGVSATVLSNNSAPELLFANDQHYSVYGYTKKQFEEEVPDIFSLILPEDKEAVIKQISQALSTGKPTTSVYRAKRRDGKVVWIEGKTSVTRITGIDFPVQVTVADDITAQVEAETREREAHEQINAILSNANSGIAATTLVGDKIKYIFVNEKYYNILGYTREQFETELPNGVMDCAIPEDGKTLLDAINSLGGVGKSGVSEFRCLRRNGTIIWVRNKGTICQLDGVSTPVYVGVIDDITEEKEAETRIRAISDRLMDSDVFFEINLTSGIIEQYRSKYEDKVSVVIPSATDTDFLSLLRPKIFDEDFHVLEKAISRTHLLNSFNDGDTTVSMDYRRVMEDGQARWFRGTTVLARDVSSDTVHAFIYSHDIDDEKKQTIALETVAETELEICGVINVKTALAKLVKCKQEIYPFVHHNKYSFEGFVKIFAEREVAEADQAKFCQHFAIDNLVKKLDNDEAATISYWAPAKDGESKRKSSSAMYLDSTHQDIIIVGRDITDLFMQEQQQQAELQKAVDAANEANRAKSEFLSRMSHDMRTPMNAVLGMVNLAKDQVNPPETVEYLSNIESSGEFLLGLINDILDLSKIESGKIELHEEPLTLDEFLRSIDTIMRPLMEAKEIDFVVDIDCGVKCISVDKLRFNQIFFNLLSNAAKFTPEKGRVEFSANFIPGRDGKHGMRFFVRDTGIGMSDEFISKIFEPFSQEITSATAKIRGSGLGLAIVKNLVEAMGGSITVKSSLGDGSEFCVDLYFNEANPVEKAVVVDAPSYVFPEKLHVLLVDDTQMNLILTEKLLQRKGCIVRSADSGEKAILMFSRTPPGYFDVVMMDVRMPGMDGLEATRRIRAMDRPDAATIPIIAITADAFTESSEKTAKAGMNAHLLKPIAPEAMYETIARLVNKTEKS